MIAMSHLPNNKGFWVYNCWLNYFFSCENTPCNSIWFASVCVGIIIRSRFVDHVIMDSAVVLWKDQLQRFSVMRVNEKFQIRLCIILIIIKKNKQVHNQIIKKIYGSESSGNWLQGTLLGMHQDQNGNNKNICKFWK